MNTDRVEGHISDVLEQTLTTSPARVFAGEIDRTGRRPRMTVHTSKAAGTRRDRRDLLKSLRELDGGLDFKVRAHRLGALERPKSLEAFLQRTVAGEIVFDPTDGFARSQRLVRFAREIRRTLGDRLIGSYWSGDWRVIYVGLDARRYVNDAKIKLSALAETENAVRRLLRETCGEEAEHFISHVKVGFGMPEVPVVPIDEAARKLDRQTASRWARAIGAPALAAFVGIGAAGAAKAQDWPQPSDLPAVSGINGKIDIRGGGLGTGLGATGGDPIGIFPGPVNGSTDDDTIIFGTGSISIPVTHSLGLQIDGGLGTTLSENHEIYGVGGHFFWRDPTVGLFGVIGSYTAAEVDVALGGGAPVSINQETAHVTRLGLESEIYIGQFTAFAAGGVQFGTIDNAHFKDGGFFDGGLTWYATDDIALTAGFETDSSSGGAVNGGVEWQAGIFGFSGLTFFFDGAYDDDDDYRALGGIRFYFGGAKSLKRRHREDDPRNNLIQPGTSGTNFGYYAG